jgi:hypothetical protein
MNEFEKFVKQTTQVPEAEQCAAVNSVSATRDAAAADRTANVDRTAENVTFRARAAASSEDPDHIISCSDFAAFRTQRLTALATLSSNPILPSQTEISPVQDKILRELEYLGLVMRTHAIACGGCAALWYAGSLTATREVQSDKR